jgi:uncharacterized membrane protein YczE
MFFQQVYERKLEVLDLPLEQCPAANEVAQPMGGNMNGCRIGFDAGGSDRKVSAVIDGECVYSEEVLWFPKLNEDPNYQYQEILTAFLTFSPGTILTVINFSLIVLAFLLLGRDMAIKTLVGSILTTVFIMVLEKPLTFDVPPLANAYVSSLIGAALIAVASGIMFYVDSSSGGTDILALIVQKFSRLQIGKALLVTDVLIVLIGGLVSDRTILFSSASGFLVKVLGIDAVIWCIRKIASRRKEHDDAC